MKSLEKPTVRRMRTLRKLRCVKVVGFTRHAIETGIVESIALRTTAAAAETAE